MKIKVSKLTGAALDWAVAKCEGGYIADAEMIASFLRQRKQGSYNYSTNWLEGGPILERRKITLGAPLPNEDDRDWLAIPEGESFMSGKRELGLTPLVAAMRCYVAYEIGDEIERPDELL